MSRTAVTHSISAKDDWKLTRCGLPSRGIAYSYLLSIVTCPECIEGAVSDGYKVPSGLSPKAVLK